MRGLAIFVSTLFLAGCANMFTAGFDPGWVARLPNRKIELAVFLYPLEQATLGRVTSPALIAPGEIADLELAVSDRLKEVLEQRGLTVSTSLRALRADHVHLWRAAIGANPEVSQGLVSAWPAIGKSYQRMAEEYLAKLRSVVNANTGPTILFLCMPISKSAQLTYGDARIWQTVTTFAQPVLFHGVATPNIRCNDHLSEILAIDSDLRVFAYATMTGGEAAEKVETASSSNSSSGSLLSSNRKFSYRQLSPSEWGRRIADKALETIDRR